jgi:electron transfer flavoprotein alpha subunit
MSLLDIAEHDNASIKPATLNTVTVAKQIGDSVDVLVAGCNCADAVNEAAKIQGVNMVLAAVAEALDSALRFACRKTTEN